MKRSLKRRIGYRVFWNFVAFGLGAGLAFYHKESIFLWLLAPADNKLSPFDGLPVYTQLTGMWMATLSIVSKGGTIAALPVLIYSVMSLVRPLFPAKFYRFTLLVIVAALLSYLAGAAFVYYVMLPLGLSFLLSFGEGVAVPLIDIASYLHLVSALMSAIGLVFLIPLLMYMLSKVGLVKYRHFKTGRYFVPLFGGFMAMILTPSVDAVNYLMVFLPILALYEVGMFLSWMQDPEDGNYLWVKTVLKVTRPVRNTVAWVWTRPDVIGNWLYEKVLLLYEKVRGIWD